MNKRQRKKKILNGLSTEERYRRTHCPVCEEKIGTIKRHYKLSYDNLAQLVGAKYGSSVIHWMNDVQPRLKYMIRINELYYKIVSKKRKAKAGSKNTFCRINPLDKNSWKVKVENEVIVWK